MFIQSRELEKHVRLRSNEKTFGGTKYTRKTLSTLLPNNRWLSSAFRVYSYCMFCLLIIKVIRFFRSFVHKKITGQIQPSKHEIEVCLSPSIHWEDPKRCKKTHGRVHTSRKRDGKCSFFLFAFLNLHRKNPRILSLQHCHPTGLFHFGSESTRTKLRFFFQFHWPMLRHFQRGYADKCWCLVSEALGYDMYIGSDLGFGYGEWRGCEHNTNLPRFRWLSFLPTAPAGGFARTASCSTKKKTTTRKRDINKGPTKEHRGEAGFHWWTDLFLV